MFSSSEYRILTPWLPTDLVGKLKLNLLRRSRSCPQEPLAEVQTSIGTDVFCKHWWNKESNISSLTVSDANVSLFPCWCLLKKAAMLSFSSRVWMTVKMFWKLKRARTWSFGNVQCLTFAPHTIPLRNRKNHLIILLNSHENHPGSKMNYYPYSHLLSSVLKLQKFFKVSRVPLLLSSFTATLIFYSTELGKQFSTSQKEPWHLWERTSN